MPGFAHNGYRGKVKGFPKAVRLTQPEEYRQVFAQAKRLSTVGLVLLYRTNNLAYHRLGLAISKKHIKRAVQRNLVKRLIREQFRGYRIHATGLDLVMLSRMPLGNANREQIHRQLQQLWERLNKQCNG